jgi:PAS domain S-box-containing protein
VTQPSHAIAVSLLAVAPVYLAAAAAAGAIVAALPLLILRRRPVASPASPAEARPEAELEGVTTISAALSAAHDAESVARLLASAAQRATGADVACVTTISEDGREAAVLLGRSGDEELDWIRDVRVDLENEPSGIATAVFEAAPFAVYDAEGSTAVHRGLVDRLEAKSIAYVPLIVEERVIAVLVLATTAARRAFTTEELTLLQALAADAALALDRTRSAASLGEALARERMVARISAQVRSELDTDRLLRIAVEETGRTIAVDRCFVRLAAAERLAAQWTAPGREPIVEPAPLPVSNLAARRRRTVAIEDIDAAPELDDETLGGREPLHRLGSRAVLATPIVVFDELIGVFALHRAQARPWTRDEIALTEAVAREVGVALHVSRLLEENRRRLSHQTALLHAAKVLTSELRLETVLQRLVEEVAALLETDAADCYLLDRDRDILRCEAVYGLPRELIGYEFPAARGLAGEALRKDAAVIAGDSARAREPVPNDVYAELSGAMVAPMRSSGTVQGVLGVGSRSDRRFTDEDKDLLDAYAGLASLALANARAFDARTRQARVERGFFRIAAVLGQTLSLGETLDAVAQAANEALGGSFAAVLMPRGGSVELAGAAELPDALASALAAGLPQGAGVLRAAAAGGRVLASPDVAEDDRFEAAWTDLARAAGYRSLLAVPVVDPREDANGLVLVFFTEERLFSDEDLELARHLADAARGALERSELFEAERTARALSQQLARTGGLLETELDPAAVLDEVVQQAPALLGAEACAIRTVEADELVVAAAVGDGLAETVGARAPSTAWLSGDVFQSSAPVAIEDVGGDERLLAVDPVLASGYSAFLGVPLSGPEGVVHGVLAVYARRPRRWRPEEVEALLALAANTSAALSNAELYSRVSLEKERSDAILANIADGIVAVDRDGKVVLWNAAAEQITGVPQEDALGRTVPEVLQRTFEADPDRAATPRLVSIPHGGDEVWLSLSEAVMRDPSGAVAGRIFAFRDISADRMVEEVKSDFVAAVSHELRTPLTSIYGFAETLLRQDVLFGEEERQTFLRYIASESERLTEIVDQLLNVARLDAGDLQVEPELIDVGSVVSEVVETVEGAGVVNGHRFELDLPDEPLAAEADRDKLRQVFSILVDNALKYSPRGGTVTVGVRRKDDTVEVRVVDQGIGIPPTEQQRIFRKFYRAESTTRDGAAGTGLGLFIAKELVTAMGGRIWVDSTEGEGSSFAFELPAARA